MTTRVQRFRAGQEFSGIRAQLNDLVDRVNQDTTPRGPAAVPVGANGLLIVEIRDLDLPAAGRLTCVNVGQQQNLNPNVITYVVDPPWTLTEASREGVNFTYQSINDRTADNPAETQRLTPVYNLGDLLMIATVDGRWRDLNVDGRQWAKVP